MALGFLYLIAIIDWAVGRFWRGACRTRLDTGFCIAALDEALERHGGREEVAPIFPRISGPNRKTDRIAATAEIRCLR
jgi:hypothetical protein